MRRLLLSTLAFAAIAGSAAADPEAVVREDVRALSAGDGEALLALFDENSRIFALPTRPDRLFGDLSPRIGTHDQRRAVFLTPMPGGPQPVEIVEMVSAGPWVAAELRAGDDEAVHTLVIFRIDGDRIARLWHVQRLTSPSPEAEAASRAVVDAFMSADQEVEARRSLLAADAAAETWPDRLKATGVIALGDLVVVREMSGPAAAEGLSAYRVRDGRIQHRWGIREP